MKTEKMGKMDTNEEIQKHMNVYQLSRSWFDFAFENPNKIKPHHSAIYFFAIEHCNRLGWKKKFGFPTSMVLDAIGMRSYSSYKKHFDELVDFGFIKVVEYSKNQYSSNIIELTFNDKAPDKALDKALIKHSAKQSESTVQSIDSIDKQINKEQINNDKKDITFFWNTYHSISNKEKTDLEASKKYWNKLKETEKVKAEENISKYVDSINDKKYIVKARTYLGNKLFNNEFKTIQESLPPLDKAPAYCALQAPEYLNELLKQGYSIEQIKNAAK